MSDSPQRAVTIKTEPQIWDLEFINGDFGDFVVFEQGVPDGVRSAGNKTEPEEDWKADD